MENNSELVMWNRTRTANAKGRVQRIRPAIQPPGEALPEWEILSRVSARMGNPFPHSSSRELLKELAGAVPAFARVTLESVGTHGVPLSPGK